jgi:hypothetical protein
METVTSLLCTPIYGGKWVAIACRTQRPLEKPVMVCNRRENNTNREQQKSTRMCFQYARRGTCKYGNSFRYLHVEDNNNNVKRSEVQLLSIWPPLKLEIHESSFE